MSRRPDLWRVLVPVVALFAGLLAVTTAHAAHGTDLRSEQTNVADLVRAAEARVSSDDSRVKQLQSQVAARTDLLAQSDSVVAAIKKGSQPLERPAGLTSVSGPGLDVTLDDAHGTSFDTGSVDANDLVVHQSDMQAVVNALWAGGAEAMTLMGQRIVATSAVRCVGNTLLLNGRVFAPPYKIDAIGPSTQMRTALDASENVKRYRSDARRLGLEYNVVDKDVIMIAGYEAPIGLSYAKVGK
jgi:uncharacterized protein YlxW (UPF0749 family)